MENSPRPDDDLRADLTRQARDAAMADVLRSCDMDKLARHLGLSQAGHAKVLVDHPAAAARLAQRLGDGCADLPVNAAVDVTRAMLGYGDRDT